MKNRSALSLEKDEFNFAINLAHGIKIHLLENSENYSPEDFEALYEVSQQCFNRCIVKSDNKAKVIHLLGLDQYQQISQAARSKARIETDFVNSKFEESLVNEVGIFTTSELETHSRESDNSHTLNNKLTRQSPKSL